MNNEERKATADSSAALRNDKKGAPRNDKKVALRNENEGTPRNDREGAQRDDTEALRNGKGLEVRFRHRLGTLSLDVAFTTNAPWTVLFGPSGSGKSTILRAIAGLVRPDEGRIVMGGQVVFDSAAGVWVAPQERPMRWAAQKAMLYPWKKVKWNLVLGMSGRDPQFGGRGWIDYLEQGIHDFGLGYMADQLPTELSGGERQRVAAVRAALGARGKTLLLDEPFTGMDAVVRDRLIGDLRAWLGDSPVVSVTHDVGEAFLLGAEVVRVAEGRVVGQGPVGEVLEAERARLVEALGDG